MSGACAPGPRGAALATVRQHLSQDPLAAYLALQQQFGDVVRLALAPHPMYLLSHPDAVQHVLRDYPQHYRKGMFFQTIAALQGQGLLTSEGDLWRQQRRLLQPPLQPQQLAALAPVLVEEVQSIVQGWQQAARTGEPVNISAWMHRLTFRLMGRAVLGLPAAALDDLGRQLQTLGAQLFPHLGIASSGSSASTSSAAFQQAVAAYRDLARHVLSIRRHTLSDGPATDILAVLLQTGTRETAVSEQQICDEIITFIGAGTETSAQVLSWALYALALHPDVREEVQAEIASTVGKRLVTPDDLPELPYGRMVLEETMRLYPPAALLPRQANVADTICGYRIPQDSIVMLSPYVTHRHADFWPAPDVFQPQRFATEPLRRQQRFAYFPFGGGPRLCIGRSFALLEMHLALATFIQAYTFTLLPHKPVVPEFATTLRPRGGLWMMLQARV